MNTRFLLELRRLYKYDVYNKDYKILVENNDCVSAKVDCYKNIEIKINKVKITRDYPMKPPDIQNLEVILINKLDNNKEIIKLKGLDNIMNYFEKESEKTESFCIYKNYEYSWSPAYLICHFFLQFSSQYLFYKNHFSNSILLSY